MALAHAPDPAATELAVALVDWYRQHRRALPWRESRDPYLIWVSEVMLQQTRVATVRAYYERWRVRFPTVRALAEASEEDLLQQWQGLGYYSRARNLQKAARLVCEHWGGQMPRDAAALRSLPGIGPYTAGAVASIAFDLPEPLLDGNVMRVLTRLRGWRGNPLQGKLHKQLWAEAAAWAGAAAPAEVNQGLMELGSLVCVPTSPNCPQCPLLQACRAAREGTQSELPELPQRPEPLERTLVSLVLHRDQQVLVRPVPAESAWWKGLWELPTFPIEQGTQPAEALRGGWAALFPGERLDRSRLAAAQQVATVRHQVTRHQLTVQVWALTMEKLEPRSDGSRWVPLPGLAELPLSRLHRKVLAAAAETLTATSSNSGPPAAPPGGTERAKRPRRPRTSL